MGDTKTQEKQRAAARMTYTIPPIPSDLMSSDVINHRRFKVSTLSSFSAAGESGFAYSRAVGLSVLAGGAYSLKIQKNSDIAIRYIKAKGLTVSAVNGDVSGNISGVFELIPTNAGYNSGFQGAVDLYDGQATGQKIISDDDGISESFYPSDDYIVELVNNTDSEVNTILSVGIEQISTPFIYSILEPSTQIQADTDMGDFNGTN